MNVTLRDHIKVNELAEKTRTHTTLLKYWMTQLALRSMVNKRIGLGRTTLHDNTVSLPISLSTLTLSISFTHPRVTAHCSHGSVVESKRCILRKHLIVNLHIYSTCLIRPLIIYRSFLFVPAWKCYGGWTVISCFHFIVCSGHKTAATCPNCL